MNPTPELTIHPTQPSLLGNNRARQPAGPCQGPVTAGAAECPPGEDGARYSR
jgi:hypothetical protein